MAIVDEKHGAYWGDFIKEIPELPPEEIQFALRSLIKDKMLRMKDDDYEHDWEYIRCCI